MLSSVAQMPEISSELALIFALIRAHSEGLPPKKREAFMRRVEASLQTQAALYNVVRVRSAARDGEINQAVSGALSWWIAAKPAMAMVLAA